MSGRSGHVRQFPTSKAQIAYSARFLNYPGKAKRESCRKKAHNDGHVPHKRKRNYPAQKVVQQMVEQLVVLHGVGAGVSSVRATATPGTHTRPGLYTPCVSILAPATPTEVVLWAKPLLFGAPPPQPQITHHACCPAVQIRRAHTWSASCACVGSRIWGSQSLGWHASGGCRSRLAHSTSWNTPQRDRSSDGTRSSGPRWESQSDRDALCAQPYHDGWGWG